MVSASPKEKIRTWAYEERGAVFLLIGGLLFFSLVLTALVIDYSKYVAASQEMKNISDQAVLKGSSHCLQSVLKSIQKNLSSLSAQMDVQHIWEEAIRDGEKQAKEEFEHAQKETSSFITPAILAITGHGLSTSTHPTSNQNYCVIEIKYTASVASMVGRLLGMPHFTFEGKAVAGVALNKRGELLSARLME